MSEVAIIYCDSYEYSEVKSAVERGFSLLGGPWAFVRPEEKILLKPNWLSADPPEKCVTTHPAVFKAVSEVLQSAGAKLSYGDSPAFQSPETVSRRSGLFAIAEELKIPLADFKSGVEVFFREGGQNKKFFVANAVQENDGVISLPKMKTHGFQRMTGAVKNQFGCIPGVRKGEFHVKVPDSYDFAKMLVDLNSYINPRLYIMDGIFAMEGNGPRGGNPRKMNVLLFSADPIALDATACRLMNLDPGLVLTNQAGMEMGAGTFLAEDIQILGDPMEPFIAMDFDVNRKPEKPFKKNGSMQLIKNAITPRPYIMCEHCDFIAEQIEAHRPQGKLKALAFCRNITHARMMCEAMSEHYKTAYLTGQNDIGERIRAYNDLQSDSADLEILLTVDILNEGVDIPGVNMVLFLRPTESSTIFIQQLGRGLRKYDNKQFVTVLDFIGNSYKRSVQIAFALSSLAENFVVEKRLMASLVRDNFLALGLSDCGVVINIDDLSKEEILEYIDKENFNSIKYLKQDYFNFKKYINSEFYPKHMDYLNNDGAPDLIRFMSVKMQGRKNCSYYNFLRGIEEETLPIFSEEQIDFANYLSGFLPLVRPHEYEIIRCLLDGIGNSDTINTVLDGKIAGYSRDELNHALEYLKFVTKKDSELSLDVLMDDQFREYLNDLVDYGITRCAIDIGEETGFKLWQNYRMDQVQLKLLKNPGANQVGTYYYDNYVVIFASLKKDASVEERLNYKDKFLQANLFQWESRTHLPMRDLSKLNSSKFAHLFIRKVSSENGIVLPFTYVGKGMLTNARKTEGANGTYLFDVVMENELPDYLQYDFGLMK